MAEQIHKAFVAPGTSLVVEVDTVLFEEQSGFQKIQVCESPDFGRMLVLDDVINLTEKDEFIYHEMLVHPALFSMPNPENVLIVGGGDGCTAREAVKHDCVETVVQVEIDPMVMDVGRRFFSHLEPALDHPKVDVVCTDAIAWVDNTDRRFDAILIDSTDKAIDQSEGIFTTDFFENCRRLLTDGGVLTAQVGDWAFEPHVVQSVLGAMKRVFDVVRLYTAPIPSYSPAPYSLAFCSTGTLPEALSGCDRFDSTFPARHYDPDVHKAAFVVPEHIREKFDI